MIRRVVVSPEWFEQLEAYLLADERCVSESLVTPWGIVMWTPFGKTLEFVPGRHDPNVLSDQELEDAVFHPLSKANPNADGGRSSGQQGTSGTSRGDGSAG